MRKLFCLIGLFALNAGAENLPAQPTEASHPGSAVYSYQLRKEILKVSGRNVELYLPKEAMERKEKITLIVFGTGQAMGSDSYISTFEHLARKGVAVAFPEYSTGFFDQEWRRMGEDYARMAQAVVRQFPESFDPRQVIYSGHSKGAYVASVAAGSTGARQGGGPAAVVLFNPAGYDAEWLRQVDAKVPVTVIWSDADTVVKEQISKDIYEKIAAEKKQYIRVSSYRGTTPEIAADHFFVANKKSFFGGRDGISPLHFFGAWKWLLGAAWDVQAGARGENPYLYGPEAATSGLSRINHTIQRSW